MKSKYYTRPLWFWNDTPSFEGIKEIMQNCKDKDHYAGFGILPYSACNIEYMSKEYLDLYKAALEEAEKLDLKICVYDEWWFPSGGAGGILKKKYPEACAKRLDLIEYTSDSDTFNIQVPPCIKLMAAVGMKDNTRIDLENCIIDNTLSWTAPDVGYKVLFFVLNSADIGRVDYLNPSAVEKFIECTHEVYYKHFKKYFGGVIDSFFYDEPQFYSAKGRAWTESFNDKFIEKYGFSPALYYPALFYDIGKETAMARHMMFSLRSELYSLGFPKTIQDWCRAHSVSLTGHVDQEEVDNPCGITGDLMLSFKYQDIPGVDEIFFEERGSMAYKVVSSSAINWNKKLVMCECFGAIEDITEEGIYRESFDLFTKGINMLVPHAVWYNPSEEKVKFKPELSYRNSYYGRIMPKFNDFCSIIQEKLQNSYQVNSVSVLYPIENLTYLYNFSWDGDPVSGGPSNEHNDYLKLGQFLSRECNCDFTFIHPEVLQSNCTIKNGTLVLENSVHFQKYSCLIIPGMTAISIKTLEIIQEFAKSGGTVISTSEFPTISIEPDQDEKLSSITNELFGYDVNKGKLVKKGNCYFVPQTDVDYIKDILRDIRLDTKVLNNTYGLQYIHKRNTKSNIWYFASIKEDAIAQIEFDGIFKLSAYDPRNETNIPINVSYTEEKTIIDLSLQKENSIIIEGIKKY